MGSFGEGGRAIISLCDPSERLIDILPFFG
jgi:hypothetical protein